MKKRSLIIIIVVLLWCGIIAYFCLYFLTASCRPNENITPFCAAKATGISLFCHWINDTDDKIICKAIAKNKPDVCNEIINQRHKDFCFFDVSIYSNEPEERSCFNILDNGRKNSCFFNAASKKQNISICEFIQGDRDGCYQRTAAVMRKTSREKALTACIKIINLNKRNLCCSMIGIDKSGCMNSVNISSYIKTCHVTAGLMQCVNVSVKKNQLALFFETNAAFIVSQDLNITILSCKSGGNIFVSNLSLTHRDLGRIDIPCESNNPGEIFESKVNIIYNDADSPNIRRLDTGTIGSIVEV